MLTCEQIEAAVLDLGPVTRDNHQDVANRVFPPVYTNGWLKRIPRRRWDPTIPEVAEAKRAIIWAHPNTYVSVAVLRAALNQRDAKLVELAKERVKEKEDNGK